MKTEQFSKEKLRKLRDGLPQGAQKTIARNRGISPQDVYKILHGQRTKPDKCNYLDILNDALLIYERENTKLADINEAIEAINNDTKKQ